MNRPYVLLLSVIGMFALGAIAFAVYDHARPQPSEVVATTTPQSVTAPDVLPYGRVTLAIGEPAQFADVSILPLQVTEDSRCPMNARCIWEGKITVSLQIVSGLGTSTNSISIGETITTEAEEIRLVSVTPEQMAGEDIKEGTYRFTFEVTKRKAAEVDPPAPTPSCYVGGCSSQICSDRPDVASTCEYRESYACYRGATCERQASGACGWTQTPQLTACLLNAGA